MYTMTRLRRVPYSQFACGMFYLALGLSQGCARPEPLHGTDANSQTSEQNLPFHPDTDHASGQAGSHPMLSPDPGLASRLPFRASSHPRVLPSGTLLTVQLAGSLSPVTIRAGDEFTGSVAAPLTIDGDTLIESGTAVTGRVESEQSQTDRPGAVPGSGYVRLTLTAIKVEGRLVELHTSSLFARGALRQLNDSSRGSPSDLRSDVRIQKGRRLTFRLTAPVTLDDADPVANRQYLGSSTQ
jgi:hypothetical protein